MTIDVDWQAEAACREGTGISPELFFPLAEVGPRNERQIAEAKAVCFGCSVAASCLDYALRERIPEGIFGGLTAAERAKLLRRMAEVQAATTAA